MTESLYAKTYRAFAEIIPQETRKKAVFRRLEHAGIREDFDIWLGKRMLLMALVFIIGVLSPWTAGKFLGILDFQTGLSMAMGDASLVIGFEPLLYSAALGFLLSAILAGVFYLHLYYQIEIRTSLVESVLPDFLMLVASNVNAGMTPFSAFRSAARKEFGPLSEEIRIATAKALGTGSFTQALSEVSKKISSSQLEQTVAFLAQSLRSGGKLVVLLETSANYLRNLQDRKKELVSSTKMYSLFVIFVVVIGTPLLLGVSVQFLEMITSLQEQNQFTGQEISTVGFLSTELLVTPEFMRTAGFLLLLINSVLSSAFIGVLAKGRAQSGIKNFPIIFIASSLVFILSTTILSSFLTV